MHIQIRQIRWLSIAVLMSTAGLFAADGGPLHAKVVKLDAGGKKELQVLSGAARERHYAVGPGGSAVESVCGETLHR